MRLGCLAVVVIASCSSSRVAPPTDAGAADVVQETVDVAPPRPVAPLSVSFTNTRRPTFRWKLAPGSDGARVEVCRDRACTAIITSFVASGDHGSPADDLPSGVVFWRLHGAVAGAAGVSASAPWELVVPRVSAARDTTRGAMLDANGDGFADVVVGDTDFFTATQHVYVYQGGPMGPPASPSAVLSAAMPVDRYAAAIASAGDVDGDGFGDVLVGSPSESVVYVYRGGAMGPAQKPVQLAGPDGSGFGASLSSAGDVDGDGYADVLVGMPTTPHDAGAATLGQGLLVYGSPSGLSLARSAPLAPHAGSDGTSFAQFVASAGDAYGDGRADIAVFGGVENIDPQEVDLYRASDPHFGAAPTVRLKFDGSSVGWLGASSLLTAADVNGDGYGDVVMSTALPVNLGAQHDHLSIFFGGGGGPAPDPSQRIDNPFGMTANFGVSLAALDVDGDGFDDLAAASLLVASPPGPCAVVFRGGPSGLGASVVLDNLDLPTTAEREVSSVGDVDGDGYADLLVGAPGRVTSKGAPDSGVSTHGAVDVYVGGPTGVSATPKWTLVTQDTTDVAFGASLPGP